MPSADRSPESQPRQSTAGKRRWPAFALLAVASTASIAQLTSAAEYGIGAVFVYILPAIVFLVPVALVAAELATGWEGGVFGWVTAGLGERWGFQAIWLQWIQSVTLYPSLLSFAAASLAFAIGKPALAKNGIFTGAVVLIIFWGATFVAMRGFGAMERLANGGLIIGTFIPVAALTAFMVWWLATGHGSQATLAARDIVPRYTGIGSIVLVIGTFIAYSGVEVNAVHIKDLASPMRGYPKALTVAVPVIVALYIAGTVAIAVVVPASKLDLDGGAAQALTAYASGFGMAWLGVALSVALLAGAVSGAVTWAAGPSRGLLEVAKAGYLPPIFAGTNAAGVQVPILLAQGGLVTVLTLLFVVLPSVSKAFWVLQAMTIILYLLMYVLMFLSVIRLRRTHPDAPQRFRVPALMVVAGVGLLAAIAAIAVGLVPPNQLKGLSPTWYAVGIAAGVFVLAASAQLVWARYGRAAAARSNGDARA